MPTRRRPARSGTRNDRKSVERLTYFDATGRWCALPPQVLSAGKAEATGVIHLASENPRLWVAADAVLRELIEPERARQVEGLYQAIVRMLAVVDA